MKLLKAMLDLEFYCIQTAPFEYRCSVRMDVSALRYAVEPVTDVVIVFGAVRAVFECLEKHFLKVLEYSSTVVEQYKNRSVFGHVNSCSDNIEKVVDDWS